MDKKGRNESEKRERKIKHLTIFLRCIHVSIQLKGFLFQKGKKRHDDGLIFSG
jgi:hypothetical protein